MERFRVLFFNRSGTVFSEKDIEADDEHGAVEYARRSFNTGAGLGYEVRDGARRLINRQIFCEPSAR